jgi:hypothetical protein
MLILVNKKLEMDFVYRKMVLTSKILRYTYASLTYKQRLMEKCARTGSR